MTDAKVLVTGGTGFIGGRLVERLMLEKRAEVRALVRGYTHAPRLGRFPLEIIKGDLSDPAVTEKAVQGCQVIYHLAHDFAAEPQANLAATEALAKAALQHHTILIYTSTIDVYGWSPDGDLDETAPRKAVAGNVYASTKIAIEKLLLDYHQQHGLNVVILQPTIVYGPYSGPWTNYIASTLKSGQPVALINNGTGLCNAVYIDDVVDALFLAAEKEQALGEAFLISGAEPITWRTFYDRYEEVVGIKAIFPMSAAEFYALNRPKSAVNRLLKTYLDPMKLKALRRRRLWNYAYLTTRFLTPRGVWLTLQERVKGRSNTLAESPLELLQANLTAITPPPILPPAFNIPMFQSRLRVKIDKARRILGYDPKYDFDAGMAITAQYMKWANLIHEPR